MRSVQVIVVNTDSLATYILRRSCIQQFMDRPTLDDILANLQYNN